MLIHTTRDQPNPPRPEYDEHGTLTGWHGIALRDR